MRFCCALWTLAARCSSLAFKFADACGPLLFGTAADSDVAPHTRATTIIARITTIRNLRLFTMTPLSVLRLPGPSFLLHKRNGRTLAAAGRWKRWSRHDAR